MVRIQKTANDNAGGKRYSWGTLPGTHATMGGAKPAWPSSGIGTPANKPVRRTTTKKK